VNQKAIEARDLEQFVEAGDTLDKARGATVSLPRAAGRCAVTVTDTR
jgi:hypothetical protein